MADTTELRDAAGQTERQRADVAGGFTDFATQIGSELLAIACEGVTKIAEEQRRRAADQIAAIGDALHCSADSLAGNSEMPLDRYAEDAAQYLCCVAQTVRARPWSQLANDVEGLARAEPMTFVAATIGIGVLAGRFLFSTPSPRPATDVAEIVPERPSHDQDAPAAATPAKGSTDGVAAAAGV